MQTTKSFDQLSLSELKALYEEIFKKKPPPKSRNDFIKGNICWAIQAKNRGKSFNILRKQLLTQAQNKSFSAKTNYLVGTRIIREWQGETHEVIVEESGFRWRNQKYKSLSHIAREITGSRWSGPRFFGLNSNNGS